MKPKIFINKESNSLYYKLAGVYYRCTLSSEIAGIRVQGESYLLTAQDIKELGLCYDSVSETLTEVSVSQLLTMAS